MPRYVSTSPNGHSSIPTARSFDQVAVWRLPALLGLVLACELVFAHGVDDGTRDFLTGLAGLEIGPLMYIGAKHMVTGYDHLLFLFGVVFLLQRTTDVVVYVSLFTLGHSITLLAGVLAGYSVDAFLVDALIGVSVVYKGFDNLRGFEACFGRRPNPRAMVLGFGLIHGLGLATKLQEFALPREHLVGNLVAFNVGVELGQLLALSFILFIVAAARAYGTQGRVVSVVNILLIAAGTILVTYQLTGFLLVERV